MRRTVVLLVFLLIAVRALPAQGSDARPSLSVYVDPPVFGTEEVAQLVIVVQGVTSVDNTPAPSYLHNLTVVGGPNMGTSFSFINGRTSFKVTFTYLLKGLAEGEGEVGPVEVLVKGKKLTSGPLKVEVVRGRVRPTPPPRRRTRWPWGLDPWQDFFAPAPQPVQKPKMRYMVKNRKPWVGQVVPVTLVLESVLPVERFQWKEVPTFSGCWSKQVEQKEPIEPVLVSSGGGVFRRYELATFLVIPLDAGQVTVGKASALVSVRSMDFFGSEPVLVTAPAVSLEAVPRPPAPSDAFYDGAVGALKYRARLRPKKVKLGEACSLEVILEGNGNMPVISAPAFWDHLEGAKVFPAEESSSYKITSGGVVGKEVWRKAILPSSEGKLLLPAVRVSVFDPVSGNYKTQVLGPLSVVVEGEEKVSAAAKGPSSGEEGKGSPLRPTPTPFQSGLPAHEEPGALSPRSVGGATNLVLVFGLGIGVGLAVAVLFLLVSRRGGVRGRAGRVAAASPAERARRLSAELEEWWSRRRRGGEVSSTLEAEVSRLRAELHQVRFGSLRADHSSRLDALEEWLRRLMGSDSD